MKLHFVGQMDEVLQIALESPLPELKEETPEALAVLPAAVPQDQPRAHQ
jgi:ATP-dependent Lon protease